MQFPVSIGLHRSSLLLFLLCAMYGIAIGALLIVPLHPAVTAAILMLVVFSLWRSIRRERISFLKLYRDGRMDCGLVDGARVPAVPLPGSTVFSWLVVLRLRLEEDGSVVALTLLPDRMSREEFRVLRLWLRWRTTSVDGSAKVS